jgi:hypothetical protein
MLTIPKGRKILPSRHRNLAVSLHTIRSSSGFFFEAAKYGGIDSGWSIYEGNHLTCLETYSDAKKNPDEDQGSKIGAHALLTVLHLHAHCSFKHKIS